MRLTHLRPWISSVAQKDDLGLPILLSIPKEVGLQACSTLPGFCATGEQDTKISYVVNKQFIQKKDTLSLTFVLEYLIVKRISTDSPIAYNINNIS